jgi:acyl carrier protein
MDRVEIEARLREVLVTELGLDAEKINPTANFEQDLDVDSLGVVELLMAMEDEFGVKIPDDEAEHIHTVGEAIELVHTKLNS